MHAVLHHHDGAIDDGAKVDRAQTHKVYRNAEDVHADKTEEQRQRNRHRHNQRRAPVAEKDQKNNNDKRSSFDQILLDCSCRGVDHIRLVIKRNDLCTIRQIQLGNLLLDLLDDLLSVFSTENDHHAGDRLTVAVFHHRSVSWKRFDFDGCHLLQQNRNTVRRRDNNISEIVFIFSATYTAHGILLLRMLNITSAKVAVVACNGTDNLVQRKVITTQGLGFNLDDKLLGLAAPGINLAHPGHCEQSITDHPIVQSFDLHQRHFGGGHGVLIHLAESRGHRIHLWLQARGNSTLNLVQSLRNKLTHKVLVHRVVEYYSDHRKVQLGRRANHL